jgi:hypothetical protein
MPKSTFFLTEVAHDWSEHNLTVVQQTIQEAEMATLARSDKESDPLLDTPNLAILRGVMRWHMVQKHLAMAAEKGLFAGIEAEWVDLGGVHVLELRGQYTSVTTHHLMEEDETPRESAFRRRGREVNEVSPVLKGWEHLAPKTEELLHLVLVHGGKTKEFAYLRAYTDAIDRSVYRQLSSNIKLMPMLLPSIDFEPVAEPLVELNPAAVEGKQANA